MARRTSPPDTRRIARERIAILFGEAAKCFFQDPGQSHRYVALAKKISMKQRVRLDREYRRQFCHHCGRFLVPGANTRIRIHHGRVVVTCLSCRKQMRYPVRRHT